MMHKRFFSCCEDLSRATMFETASRARHCWGVSEENRRFIPPNPAATTTNSDGSGTLVTGQHVTSMAEM